MPDLLTVDNLMSSVFSEKKLLRHCREFDLVVVDLFDMVVL